MGRRRRGALPAAPAPRLLVAAPGPARAHARDPARHTHPTLAHRLEKFPAPEHERSVRYKVFAYDGLIDQAGAEVAWAMRGLALVDELEGAPATQP